MTLARLPLLLAFSALSTCAIAGDNLSSSQKTSSNAEAGQQHAATLVGGADSLPPDPDVAPQSRLQFPSRVHNLVLAPEAQDGVPLARFRTRQGFNLADANADVCYAMRTYKVKPSERIRDDENFFRGYSQCEMASNFQIRSAEAHEKKPRPDEPPATLK